MEKRPEMNQIKLIGQYTLACTPQDVSAIGYQNRKGSNCNDDNIIEVGMSRSFVLQHDTSVLCALLLSVFSLSCDGHSICTPPTVKGRESFESELPDFIHVAWSVSIKGY